MLTLKVINSYDDFISLRSSWNHLLERSESNGIFLTWEWLRNWWDTFKLDKELLIILGYRNDDLVAIAPFMTKNCVMFGFQLRSIEFIGSGLESMPDHLNLITLKEIKYEFIRRICDYLQMHKHSWDILRLNDMQEDHDLMMYLPKFLGADKVSILSKPQDICPYIELPGSWDDYLHNLSSEGRYSIKRKDRSLKRAYKVEFSIWNDEEHLENMMRKLEEIHKSRMIAKGMGGASTDALFWEFHRKIARQFMEKGWLLLGVLTADDAVAACQYSFQYGGKAYYYQSGMDQSFGKYGVGVILMADMIKESIRRGLGEYDFLRGEEEYKSHWTNKARNSAEIIVWNDCIKPKALSWVFALKEGIRGVWNSFAA